MSSAVDSAASMEVKESLQAPELSIDRIVMLVYFPCLSLYNFGYEDYEDEEYKMRCEAINMFDKIVRRHDVIDPDSSCSSGTELYQYHYRLKGGIDLQFSSRYGVKHRIDDEGYVKCFGSDDDIDRGYIDEYHDQNYNIRIEYNPNKNNILSVSSLLHIIAARFPEMSLNALIKITRLDIAIDYPLNINPALTFCRYARKHFICGDNNGIESVYYNSQRSRHFFCIYNKKLEYRQQQKIDYTGDYLWRFELRASDAFPLYQVDYMKFYDVWNRLSIFASGTDTGDWIMNLLLFFGSKFGMSAAFAGMPVATRNRWKKKYRSIAHFPMDHPAQVFFNVFTYKWESFLYTIQTAFGRVGESIHDKDLKHVNAQMFYKENGYSSPDEDLI